MGIGITKRAVMAGLVLASSLCVLGQGTALAQTKLRLAAGSPESAAFYTDYFAPLAEQLTKDSNGALEVQAYGLSLATVANAYDRVSSGIADIGWATFGLLPRPVPLSSVVNLPFLVDEPAAAAAALSSMIDDGLMGDEFSDVKVLQIVVFDPNIVMSRAPIHVPQDMVGAKVRTPDAIGAQVAAELGAAAVSLGAPEIYQAFSTGLINATITPYTSVQQFQLQDILTDILEVPLGSAAGVVFMNRAKYEALDAEGKAAIDAVSGEAGSRMFTGFTSRLTQTAKQLAISGGVNIHEPDAAQLELWRASVAPVTDAWVRDQTGGKAVFDEFVARSKARAAQ